MSTLCRKNSNFFIGLFDRKFHALSGPVNSNQRKAGPTASKTEQKPFSFDQSSPQQQKSSADTSDSNPFAGIQLKSESNGDPFVFEAATKTEQKPSIKDMNTNFFKAIQDNWKDGNVAADLSSFMAQYIHMAENYDGGDGDSEDENGNNSAGQFSGES